MRSGQEKVEFNQLDQSSLLKSTDGRCRTSGALAGSGLEGPAGRGLVKPGWTRSVRSQVRSVVE